MHADRHARSQVQRVVSPALPQDEPHDWYFSDEPKPCECGSKELTVIEVVPAMSRERARVSVRCPKCGAIGQDTCHGAIHAVRRWNWHGDQRANDEVSDAATHGVQTKTSERGGVREH